MAEAHYSIYLPSYTIGHDSYQELGTICAASGRRVVVMCGVRAYEAAGAKLEAALAVSPLECVAHLELTGDCTEQVVEELAASSEVASADMLFAVGGGKVCDTTKAVGERTGKPVYAFPTIASNCAACTAVSIMYNDDGSFSHPYFLTHPPLHTFIDLDVLAAAPARYIWAGMGDSYAKYFEAEMSSRNEVLPHYVGLGVQISRMCLDPVLTYGRQALADNEAQVASEAFEEVVLDVIVTTALASILLTKDKIIDYNTGLAHAINYGLTAYPDVEKQHLHGEMVSFGVLLLLLVDGQREMFEELFRLSMDIGLPTRLEDLGLSEAQERAVLRQALAQKDIDHNPYRITEEMLSEALGELKRYRASYVAG